MSGFTRMADRPEFSGILDAQKYSRGRRGAPAKGVGRVTGARVQISPSAEKKASTRMLFVFSSAGYRQG